MGDAQRDSGDNGDDDADEQRARHVAGSQGNRHDDGDDADDKGGGGDVAQADERTGASGDDAGVAQADHGDKQAQTHRDGVAQDHGDGVHDGLAQAAQDEQQDDDTLEEDNAHGHVPVAAAHGGGDARDHGVDAQTRRAGERAVGEDAHADGHDAGAQAGGAGERSRINASAREHCGVDGDDVGHRQECCQSSAKFGPDCGLALTDVKKFVHAYPFLVRPRV